MPDDIPFWLRAPNIEPAARQIEGPLVHYRGKLCHVVLGPPHLVEQANGALLGSGLPSINMADPRTGELLYGLTVEIPEAPLKPGQVLVCGKAEGLRALTEAGVVRHTGDYYRSR